jgi:hypothetical protein
MVQNLALKGPVDLYSFYIIISYFFILTYYLSYEGRNKQ